jgi:ribonuclease BN (tRNA processing enzyme)
MIAAEKITNKPIVAVFNTHVHGDHWLGNQAIVERYPAVKIYAHPNMIEQANRLIAEPVVAVYMGVKNCDNRFIGNFLCRYHDIFAHAISTTWVNNNSTIFWLAQSYWDGRK